MNINTIIQNTKMRLERMPIEECPRKILAMIFDIFSEVYPQGHLFESEMTFDSSGPIYAEYPEFIHAEMAWGKANLKFVGLDYPIIRPYQHFLGDIRLKTLMASNKKLDSDDLAAGSGFMAVSVNVLHNVREAILNKLAMGDLIPLEFNWMNGDCTAHQKLTVIVDLKHERIHAVTHGVRLNSFGSAETTSTVYVDGEPLTSPDLGERMRKVAIHNTRLVVQNLRLRIMSSKNPLNDFAYFTRGLINAQGIRVKHMPNEFVKSYLVKEPSSFDWKYASDRPRPGMYYHKWVVKNTTHVGLLTNVKSANGGLCILWFSLIYEDKEHKLYLSSDNIERKLLKLIPLREVCGRKCELGHPVNKEGWETFRKIIDQLTDE